MKLYIYNIFFILLTNYSIMEVLYIINEKKILIKNYYPSLDN